jgi:hypothetical protein
MSLGWTLDSKTKLGSQSGKMEIISEKSVTNTEELELVSWHLQGREEELWQGGIFRSMPMDFSQREIEFSHVLAHRICPSRKNTRIAAQIRLIYSLDCLLFFL